MIAERVKRTNWMGMTTCGRVEQGMRYHEVGPHFAIKAHESSVKVSNLTDSGKYEDLFRRRSVKPNR